MKMRTPLVYFSVSFLLSISLLHFCFQQSTSYSIPFSNSFLAKSFHSSSSSTSPISALSFPINRFKINDKIHGLYAVKKSAKSSKEKVEEGLDIEEDEYNDEEEPPDRVILDDFDQIIQALNLFKEIYGDLDIPSRFEVPAEDQWPTSLHGLRLGPRLKRLLASRKFLEGYPDRVNELRSFGLKSEVNSLIDEWDLLYETLLVYKEQFGDLRIPNKYIVPDEDPWPRMYRKAKLGARVAAIRSQGRHVRGHPDRKELLDSIGFEWRLRDNTYKQQLSEDIFEQVYTALTAFKDIVKASVNEVPTDFVVPNKAPWPQIVWGMKLGQHVMDMRDQDKLIYGHKEREQRLFDIGFSIDSPGRRQIYSKRRFEVVFSALEIYKDMFDDLMVPQVFVVPSEEPWPEEAWGLKLGARVNAIRSQGALISSDPDRRERLNSLGFVWELPKSIKRRAKLEDKDTNEISNSLDSTYRKSNDLFDDSQSEFLSKTLKGDDIVDTLLSKKNDEGINASDRLQLMGSSAIPTRMISDNRGILSFDPSRMHEPSEYREIAAEAIQVHMEDREWSQDPNIREIAHFEGHLTPQEFNKAIARPILEEDIEAMKTIGYRIIEFGRFNWDDVLKSLETYKTVHGHINVPHSFIIDEAVLNENVGFDERFEGLRLGEVVAGLRSGDIDGLEDPIRYYELEALGFEWGDTTAYQRYRFVPMILGLRIYRHLYGFPMPQCDFVVPDEPQWPYWMKNMPLGLWSTVCRIQQEMMRQYYPERVAMLYAMNYLWWQPPGRVDKRFWGPIDRGAKGGPFHSLQGSKPIKNWPHGMPNWEEARSIHRELNITGANFFFYPREDIPRSDDFKWLEKNRDPPSVVVPQYEDPEDIDADSRILSDYDEYQRGRRHLWETEEERRNWEEKEKKKKTEKR